MNLKRLNDLLRGSWLPNLLLGIASRFSLWLLPSPVQRQRRSKRRRWKPITLRRKPITILWPLKESRLQRQSSMQKRGTPITLTEEEQFLDDFRSSYAMKEPDATSLALMAELWQRAEGGSTALVRHSIKKTSSESEAEAAGLEFLPLHLQTVILRMLPPHKILQLRIICRSWNSVLQSREFLHHPAGPLQEAESWFILARVGDTSEGLLDRAPLVKKLVAYSPSLGRYFPFPGLHHPQIVSSLGVGAIRVSFDEYDYECCGYLHPVAMRYTLCGAGGLLCCLVHAVRPRNDICLPLDSAPETAFSLLLYVCRESVVIFNPLTGAVHTLPPHPDLEYSDATGSSRISMHVHNGNHYYVALFTRVYIRMVVYNSMTGSWKAASKMRDAGCDTLHSLVEGDLFLYYYSWVFFYNLERDLWCKKKLQEDSLRYPCAGAKCFYNNATLLRCGGRILLAAPLELETHEIYVLGFAIWKLDIWQEEVKAILLSCTPTELWERVEHPVCSDHIHCSFTTNGTHVCMTGSYHMVPLLYDLVGDKWFQLPSYKGNSEYISLSSFQPRLDVAPLP